MTLDAMTAATRLFNTPLLIEPGKAAIIAQVFGPRFLKLGASAGVEVAASPSLPKAPEANRGPRMGSMVADGLFHAVQAHGGYSIVRGVAVIPVVGSLVRRGSFVGQSSGTTSYEGISAQIRAAVENPEVRAIALEIDSYGGEAAGAFALAREIRAARAEKPVAAFLAEFGFSGGYLIASQADRITIPPHGGAGSIGVASMHFDFEDQLKTDGVKVTLVHSGAYKVDGNPFSRLPEHVRAEMQESSDAMWLEFAQEVGAGRGSRFTVEQALATEARVYRGAEAVALGLCDEVAEARTAFEAFVDKVNPPATMAGRVEVQHAAHAATATAGLALAVHSPQAAVPVAGLAEAASRVLTGLEPITGAAAPSKKETDMSKTVEKPAAATATANTAADAQAQTAPVANQSTEGSTPETAAAPAPVVADASWVMAKCEKQGLSMSVAREIVDAGLTREAALERILDAKADRAQDGGEIRPTGRVAVVADGRDRAREGMTKALLGKAGLEGGERNEFTSMSLREMSRASLAAMGITPKGGTLEFAAAVFAPAMASGGMHSTSDFTSILVDVANKSMLKGFSESPEVFERFTSVGVMTDFKATKRVGLDEFPALAKVAEGAEFTYGKLADHAETAILATYGKLFALSRQTIINDDLDAFTRIPMKMGRAARRTVGDLVFAVLTGNPDMSDGTALFHADHSNLAGSAGAPSEATINAAITAMSTQKDRSENATALNIAPRYLIAPPKWRSATLHALNSEYAPDDTAKVGTAKQPRAYNTVRDAAEPIFDARLTGDSWFMTADPTVHDVIEVGYLDGNPAPFLEQQDGWSVDGTEFKVRLDACATPLAYQTLYKNAGS